MQVFLDCLPCVLRQALESARQATDDEAIQQQIMTEVIGELTHYATFANAPDIARTVQGIVKTHTGNPDPYQAIKQRDLAAAKAQYPIVYEQFLQKDDALYWALKAAATGNVLDSAIGLSSNADRLVQEYQRPFAVCDMPLLQQRLKTAKSLLLIGDNTGETVFDGLLLQQFPDLKLYYAVRNQPVLNDATYDDAVASGLDAYAEILSTGCDVPGVLLDECSDAFLQVFHSADIVITKGQGNFETLSNPPRELFYLLKAKCPVVAKVLDVPLSEFVFRYRAACK